MLNTTEHWHLKQKTIQFLSFLALPSKIVGVLQNWKNTEMISQVKLRFSICQYLSDHVKKKKCGQIVSTSQEKEILFSGLWFVYFYFHFKVVKSTLPSDSNYWQSASVKDAINNVTVKIKFHQKKPKLPLCFMKHFMNKC